MQLILWIAGAIGSAFIGMLVTMFFQERVSVAVAGVLGRIGLPTEGRNVSGVWYTYWYVVREDASSDTAAQPSPIVGVFRLRKIGNRVVGVDSMKKQDFAVSASIRDRKFLTGTWHNYTQDRYHWGAFQLCWNDSGDGMVGKFVGKDSANHVNHGVWIWARHEANLESLAEWTYNKAGYEFDLDKFRQGVEAARADQLTVDVRKQ